ncbi:MAG TPA: nitrate- and nitrite sensing domain-containing protein, partial [Streptosporangiaceae bacterium]|nr:nitrate- and nitrite sensing domain-containing protein [Streptosporangiaceae bacterium]
MTAQVHDEARWQYQILWRYSAISLVLVGLLAMGFGVLGGTYVATSVQNALAMQRAETLARLSSDVTGLAAHLEDERDLTMEYIGQGINGRAGTLAGAQAGSPAAQNLSLVRQEQTLTEPWVRKVSTDSAAVGAGYLLQVQQGARNLVDQVGLLGTLRTAATATRLPAADVMASYTKMIDELLS